MARQTHNKESISLENFLQLVTLKNEEFKLAINSTDYETIKVRSAEAMEHLKKGLHLPFKHWCSDSNVAEMDIEIPKVVFQKTNQMDNLNQQVIQTEDMDGGFQPEKVSKAYRERLIVASTTNSINLFNSEEIKQILKTCHIVQYKDHHFQIAARQPSDKIFSELIKLTARRIRLVLRELSLKINA